MKTPEQWLEEYPWRCRGKVALTHAQFLAMVEAIQKDAVACTQSDHNKALSQLRSFLHNELHKVNFGRKP